MPRALHFLRECAPSGSRLASNDIDAVHHLRATRARASGARARGDDRDSRILRLAGAPLRARRFGRFAAARRRSRSPVPAGAADALPVAGSSRRHLRAGRRRIRRGVPRAASRTARSPSHRSGCRIGHQHPRCPPARQRRRGLAVRGGRQHPHPGCTGDGPRASESGATREPGVRAGRRERRCADHGAPARDGGQRAVPRTAREPQPASDRALRAGSRRRQARGDRRSARRHRAALRGGEAPGDREPAGRDRGHPGRARRLLRRRASGRRADDRGRHGHVRTQRPRRLRNRRGDLPRDRAQPDLPRGAMGGASARGLLLRRPAHDRDARPRGVEGHGDLVELPGPDAHRHHIDEHPPHGALPPASPRLSRALAPRPRRRHGAAHGMALPVHRAHHHHRVRLARVQRHQAGHRLRVDDEHRARGDVRDRIHPVSRHRAAARTHRRAGADGRGELTHPGGHARPRTGGRTPRRPGARHRGACCWSSARLVCHG